jgi:hypothetical protein
VLSCAKRRGKTEALQKKEADSDFEGGVTCRAARIVPVVYMSI